MKLRSMLIGLIFLAAFLGSQQPAQASYYCIEVSDCCSCSGTCTYINDATGRVTGRVFYQC